MSRHRRFPVRLLQQRDAAQVQGTTRSTGSSGLYQFRERNRIRFDINQYNGYAGGPFNWAGAFIQPDRSQEDKSAFGTSGMARDGRSASDGGCTRLVR